MKSVRFIFAALGIGLTGCAASHDLSDRELLEQCWNALPVGGDSSTFRIAFDAIVIPGVEGGTYARTARCPDMRLGLSFSDADVSRVEIIGERAMRTPALGSGIRGVAIVSVQRRTTPNFLFVAVRELKTLNEMTPPETLQFTRIFQIG